jgi:hypothetical protein
MIVMEVLPEIIGRSDYQDKDKPWRWVLLAPVTLTLSTGEQITIPKGYRTDFASVPRLLRGVVATIGRHNLATLVHDFLYDMRHPAGRLFADREMRYWLRQCGVSEVKAQVMYLAVRLGGRKWWIK